MNSELDRLVHRVATLERQNRQLKMIGAGIVMIAIVAAIFLPRQPPKTPKIIDAEEIVVRDRHGRARITISTPAVAGGTVDTNPDDPIIWLSDGKGTDRAMLSTDGLRFANSYGGPTISLHSAPNGLSELNVYTDGKVSWSAP